MQCKAKVIRFTPILQGSGKYAQIIVAAVLIVAGSILNSYGFGIGQPMVQAGISMGLSGVINLFVSPSKNSGTSDDSVTSYYFDGPVNTTQQGVPVPLVFGRCKVGSMVINSGIEMKDK